MPSKKVKTSFYPSAPVSVSDTEKYVTIRFRRVYLVAVVIVLLGLLWVVRSWFVAAVVNGQPISRLSVVRILEQANGKDALDKLVTADLIFQEASKKGVTITEKDVANEIKKIEEDLKKNGQNLDEALKSRNMTKDELVKQLRIQMTVTKILSKEVKVTDKEVQEYMDKNKDQLPKDQDQAKLKEQVKAQLVNQKLSEKYQSWVDELRKKSSILYFVQY